MTQIIRITGAPTKNRPSLLGRLFGHSNSISGYKNKISITDFTFRPSGYGHYKVTYESPVTGKQWSTVTSDMPLIDATKNSDNPKVKDLEELKYICKNY